MSQSSKTLKVTMIALFVVILLGLLYFFVNSNKQSTSLSHADERPASLEHVRTIHHAQGDTSIPVNPQQVAVFDMASLSVLDALDVKSIIGVAGADSIPKTLEKYKNVQYRSLGTLFEPNYEVVNAANPDLIIVGGRSSAKYKELSSIAATIDMPRDYNQPIQAAINNAKLMGDIFNKQTEAQHLIDQLNDSIKDIKTKTADRGTGLIVLVTGGKMSAYGAGSRFGVIHTDFGVPEAAEGLTTTLHGEAISAEFIQKTNPDWLFVIDRDAAIGQTGAAKQVLENALVKTTHAWKNNQVVYLEPTPWYLISEGIVAVQAMTDEISQAYQK